MASKKKNKSKSSKKLSLKSVARNVVTAIIATVIVVILILLAFKKDYLDQFFINKISDFSHKTGFVIEDFELTTSNEYCPLITTSLLEEFRNKSIFSVSLNKIKDKLSECDCVQDVRISRSMPDKLKVEVINQEPAAILQKDKRFYFITKTNNIMKIRNSENIDSLIIFTGKNSEEHALYLLGVLSVDANIFSQIDSVMRVGERRWDVRMKNGTEIKLPEKDPEIAWTRFLKLSQESDELRDNKAKIVDLRINAKVYIHSK